MLTVTLCHDELKIEIVTPFWLNLASAMATLLIYELQQSCICSIFHKICVQFCSLFYGVQFLVDLCDTMMTSSNGNSFQVTGPLCREFTGHRHRSPVTAPRVSNVSLDVFFDVSLNKQMNKQSICQWFETQCGSCDFTVMIYPYSPRLPSWHQANHMIGLVPVQ